MYIYICTYIYIHKRKNLRIECAQGDRPARCPNHFFAVNEASAVPWWYLFWNHEIACGVRWSSVVGCEVTWGELLWLVATWHVMSCHLVWWSYHLMPCDCLCCVMSRDATRCHVMCAHVVSCHLLCHAMGWNVMSVRRHWLWGHVVWFEVVLWRCGDPTVFFSTTKYYSSITLVLLQYCKVLLQYYSVLLQYYSVLQSTTAVLLCTTKYCCSTTCTRRIIDLTRPILEEILNWKMQHLALRLFPKISQNVGPATKSHTPPSPNTTPARQKKKLMIDPPHTWNVIDNARSNKSQPPTSPNTLRLSPKICDMLRLKSDTPTSPNAVPATKSDTATSPNAAPATKAHTPPSPSPAPVTKNALYSSLRIYSLRIYSLLLYSLRIYSLRIYSLRIYSLLLYSLRLYSLRIYSLLIYSR